MSHQHIKEHYDKEVPEQSAGRYEIHRWFKTKLDEAAYLLTATAIKRLLKDVPPPERVLEVGPGPGTWTKILLELWPEAKFDLVDISSAMLAEAKIALPKTRVKLIEADFTTYKSNAPYDFFFSSRAFEYFSSKEEFVAQVNRLLKPGGEGVIITKLPHFWLNKLRGHKVPKRHADQKGSLNLTQFLTRFNFRVLKIQPVTVSVPFLKSALANKWVGKLSHHLPLSPLTMPITESYGVRFKQLEVVELFGLSATGKTTLAGKLADDGFKWVKVRGRRELLWLNLIFVSYFPYASYQFLKLAWHSRRGPKKLFYLKLVNLFLQANAKWLLAREAGKAVIDQGHSQNFLSLFEHAVGEGELKKLAAILPRPSELIILEVEEEERLARLKARGTLPRAEFGLPYANHWQKLSAENYERFKKALPTLHFTKVTFF